MSKLVFIILCILGQTLGHISSEFKDLSPLKCRTLEVSSCAGFKNEWNCHEKSWKASALITDNVSKLSSIETKPTNIKTSLEAIYDHSSATATFTASCCDSHIDLVASDVQGNVGSCSYRLNEGEVLTFEVIDQGTTYITLQWSVGTINPDLAWYHLVTVNGPTNDIPCHELVCTYTASYLQSCREYDFELTPYYYNNEGGDMFEGTTSYTSGETTDVAPNPPTNGEVIFSDSNATIIWDPPVNQQCLSSYEVCYALGNSDYVCTHTNNTYLVIEGVQYCTSYTVQITSESVSGLSSSSITIVTDEIEGVPGQPTDLQIVYITPTSANISWNEPAINPSCAADYDVNWKPANFTTLDEPLHEFPTSVESNSDGKFWAVVYPLLPCASYGFFVNANSRTGVDGPVAIVYGDSDEITPSTPIEITVTTDGTDSIIVEWVSGGDVCVDHFLVCYTSNDNNHEDCSMVYNNNTYVFMDLLSCTTYVIRVATVSPDGVISPPITAIGATDDEIPGPPENLVVVNSTDHSLIIDFDGPSVNPQCVAEYNFRIADVNASSCSNVFLTEEEELASVFDSPADHTNTIDGLFSCTLYAIEVYAVSPQGYEGNSSFTAGSTLEDTPNGPSQMSAVALSTTSILLHWYPPTVNCRCVATYQIVWIDENSVANSDVVDADSTDIDYSYTITNLDPCMRYQIGVTPRTATEDSGSVGTVVTSTQC